MHFDDVGLCICATLHIRFYSLYFSVTFLYVFICADVCSVVCFAQSVAYYHNYCFHCVDS